MFSYIKERRVHFEVFGHHVEAEEVPVDALAAHGVLVRPLVLGTGLPQEGNAIVILKHQLNLK